LRKERCRQVALAAAAQVALAAAAQVALVAAAQVALVAAAEDWPWGSVAHQVV